MTAKKIAESIPHEYRLKILFDWIPQARSAQPNKEFQLLWEAYFVYVDPGAVKKDDCPVCRGNVLDNWKLLAKEIAVVEKEYNTLEKIC